MDFVFFFFALYLLYRVVDVEAGKTASRPAAVGLFLAFLCFPIMWVVPWQRIETVPTAFYLACALALLGLGARRAWCTWTLLGLTVWQGFVRSDVPAVLGMALVLVSLTNTAKAQFGSRRFLALRGMAIAFLAGVVQLYLQRVRFPHARYEPNVSVIRLGENLAVHNLGSLALAMLPVLLIGGVFFARRPRLSAMDLIIITASALYLPLWLTVGLAAEVRLYVPFLMALCVVAAKIGAIAIAVESPQIAEEVSLS